MSGSGENEVKVKEPVMKKPKIGPTPSDVGLGTSSEIVQKLDESESSEDESESLEDESESAEEEAEASEYEAESSEDESESSEDESVNQMVAGEDEAPMELKPDQITERLKSLLLPRDRLTKAGLEDYLSESLRKPLTLRNEAVPHCFLGDSSSSSEDFNSPTDILLLDVVPKHATRTDIKNFFAQNSMEVGGMFYAVDPETYEKNWGVKLKSTEDVKRALKELNGSTICGSIIYMEATPNNFRVIYIRGFNRNLDEGSLIQQLKETFKSEEADDAVGKKDLVLKNVLLPKKKNGRLQRFGYLIYDNATEAHIEKILDKEYTIGGRKITLRRCKPRGRAFRSLLA